MVLSEELATALEGASWSTIMIDMPCHLGKYSCIASNEEDSTRVS